LSLPDATSPDATSPDATSPGVAVPTVPTLPDAAPALIVPAPLSADELAAYHDLQHGAVWCASPDVWSTFRGPKAAEALNGLVTNDVTVLEPGHGQQAAALTPKGKVLCDMLILRTDAESFLLAMRPACATVWLATAKKYVNPRLAKVADEGTAWTTWLLYGPRTAAVLASLGAGACDAWVPWQHGRCRIGAAEAHVISAPLVGVLPGGLPGAIIVADAAAREAVEAALVSSEARAASAAVWDVARVESGRPVWGVDMDDNTIPQEANLDTTGAISFTKGCYTGQETVARLHFRGHVNRRLRGLRGASALPMHAEVVDAGGKSVGTVRSSVLSPRAGPVALAMLRREVVAGDTVRVLGVDGDAISADVVELPFPA
jgi:folate-binding protein YgfZ